MTASGRSVACRIIRSPAFARGALVFAGAVALGAGASAGCAHGDGAEVAGVELEPSEPGTDGPTDGSTSPQTSGRDSGRSAPRARGDGGITFDGGADALDAGVSDSGTADPRGDSGGDGVDAGRPGDDDVQLPTLVLPEREGGVVSASVTLERSKTLPRLSLNSCNGSSLRLTVATPYAYVRVHNPHPSHEAEVSVWTERAPSGPVIDTVIAAYARASVPQSEAERLRCTVGVEQSCRSRGSHASACRVESGGADWAGLMRGDARSVRVASGESVTVYVAAYRADESGEFVVAAAVDALR